jgi:hypothetical protein
MHMKKLLFTVLSAFLLCSTITAMDLIPLTICPYENEQPGGNDFPKTPITAPKVYIDDYTLLFEANHPEYVLNIKDEGDNVVYTTTVYSTQTQVVLPSILSGDYQIELVMGYWLFTGYITL